MAAMRDFWIRYRAPIILLLIGFACVLAFKAILRPFLVAIFIAYLIDPIVRWAHHKPIFGRRLPRGVAVLGVYFTVLVTLTLGVLLITPKFVEELDVLKQQDISKTIKDVRETSIPAINQKLDRIFSVFATSDDRTRIASDHVLHAMERAEQLAFVYAVLPDEDQRARLRSGELKIHEAKHATSPERELVRMVQDEDGAWSVMLVANSLEFQPQRDGSYTMKLPEEDLNVPARKTTFDLERAIDNALDTVQDTMGRQFANFFSLSQRVLGALAGVLFSILVTLMVAAFISIDVPNIQSFIRSLFPKDKQDTVGDLLVELDRGLSGVIRGQLVICLINGVLTTIGLLLLKVKFAVVLGIIAGVFSLIPVFGAIISGIPCALVALTQGVTTSLLVIAWIAVIHFIEGNILGPKILGHNAKIHPALIVFALLAGEHVYGILGALLAVPAASIIQTLYMFFIYDRRPRGTLETPTGSVVVATSPSEPS